MARWPRTEDPTPTGLQTETNKRGSGCTNGPRTRLLTPRSPEQRSYQLTPWAPGGPQAARRCRPGPPAETSLDMARDRGRTLLTAAAGSRTGRGRVSARTRPGTGDRVQDGQAADMHPCKCVRRFSPETSRAALISHRTPPLPGVNGNLLKFPSGKMKHHEDFDALRSNRFRHEN